MASHREEVAALTSGFYDAMRIGTFLLCHSHGEYNAETLYSETVPPNTYIFEAQTLGDYCYATITPVAWNILQPMMRDTFIRILNGSVSLRDKNLTQFVHFVKQFTVYGPGDTYYNRELTLNEPAGIPLGIYSFGEPSDPYCVPPKVADEELRPYYKANKIIREFCQPPGKCQKKPDCAVPEIYDVIAPPLEADTASIVARAVELYAPTKERPLVLFFISCAGTDFSLTPETVQDIMDSQDQQRLKYLEVTPALLGSGVNYPPEMHKYLPGFRTPDPNFFRVYGQYVEDEPEKKESGYLPLLTGGGRRKTRRRLKLRRQKRVTRHR